ncbi:MAG: hypothetical protein QGI08_05785 [Paracoccaceae bacterium]|jgi:bifunctional DNA-binding transcriptional regulator/antitoxin component of YhaV-PrlF toxin-antitoxin module|nr:hypothetical protein [Paracoccaceae bacterium]MDP7185214.1 hypothetical protein [Paracoccaceae bacterium]
MISTSFEKELSGIKTISDKIRFLDRKGMERAEIARVLGKRYQHVRNVLERDASLSKADVADSDDVSLTRLPASLSVSSTGTIEMPKWICEAIGLYAGQKAVIRLEGDCLVIKSSSNALDEARRKLKQLLPAGSSLAEELLKERREEVEATQ